MELTDVEVSEVIRGPDGEEVRVVGLDMQGPAKQRGSLILLSDGRILTPTMLKDFQCVESCRPMSNSPEPPLN